MSSLSSALELTNKANIWSKSGNITLILIIAGCIAGVLLYFFWVKPTFIDSQREDNRGRNNF